METEADLLKSLQPEDIDKLYKLYQIFSGNSNPLLQNRITVLDLYNEIISYAEHNFSPKHVVGISLAFKHFMKHFSPKREIGAITQHDIEKFIIALKQKVPEGYRNYFRNLRAAFNRAKEWGYIRSESPFSKIKLPKKQQVKPLYLTKEQLQKVCANIKIETVKDVVIVGWYSGMRLNELVHLTADCVDLDKRTITVGSYGFTTKNRRQRTIPFGNEVYEILSRRILPQKADKDNANIIPINGGYVFVKKKNNGHYTGDFFSKRFKRAALEAGMPKEIHFHNLRNSCACNLINSNVSVYLVKEILGHSGSSTYVTEMYCNADISTLREAILKL